MPTNTVLRYAGLIGFAQPPDNLAVVVMQPHTTDEAWLMLEPAHVPVFENGGVLYA